MTKNEASGEDFATIIPWHVDSGWIVTSSAGEEWLVCPLVPNDGSPTRRSIRLPINWESPVNSAHGVRWEILIWYWISQTGIG